LSLVVTQQGL